MQKKPIQFLIIIFIFLLSSTYLNGDSRPEWENFCAKYKNKYPNEPAKKAKYLAGLVGEAFAQLKVDPNYDALGRARAYRKYGNQAAGTCGDIAEIMRNVFRSAGFEHHQMFKIVVKKKGLDTIKRGWIFDLNTEHTVFGVVVNGKPIVFEPWAYGGDNGSFHDFYKSIWNGMDLDVWLSTMKKHNYSTYSYGDSNFKYININDIYILLRKVELKGSGRLGRRPRRIQNNNLNDSARIENEFRALYKRWLRMRDSKTSVTTVKVNARKEKSGKYFNSIETKCTDDRGKTWVCASRELYMTLGDLRSNIREYKKDLGIK